MGAVAQSEPSLPFQPLYDGSARERFAADAGLGALGTSPYTRGVHPAMSSGRPWTMWQYAGFGTAQESSERHHGLVGAGTLRTARDNDAVGRALDALRDGARSTDNVLDPIREALRQRATAGEVSHVPRDVWGRHVPHDTFRKR